MSDLATHTRPTLVEVMTPHCVECRAMQPDLDAVAGSHLDIVDLVVVDATREPERVAALHVRGTPTLIAMKDGVEIARFTGRRSRKELNELFAAVAAGDTSEVSSTSRSDRLIWGAGGGMLLVAGLLAGPSWALILMGAGLAGYTLIRSVAG